MMVQPNKAPLPVRLVASGSHRSELDEQFAQTLGDYNLIRMGSSLKACIIAEGNADLYPRFGPTACWDIAAAHAIVSSAGGLVLNEQGNTLNYDIIKDTLNPHFLIAADNRWTKDWIYQTIPIEHIPRWCEIHNNVRETNEAPRGSGSRSNSYHARSGSRSRKSSYALFNWQRFFSYAYILL